MSDDLKRGLLSSSGKQSNFEQMYEECVLKIQGVKQKNNYMQQQIGTELEDSVREEVRKQKDFVEKEIKQVKELMDEMERKFKDLQSRNRIKELKTEAQKQIERNKIILRDFINKSFIVHASNRNEQERMEGQLLEEGQFMEGGQMNFTAVQPPEEKESMLTDQQLEIDYDLERKMLKEKSEMINEVEQATLRINDIMNDIGSMVDEQGDNLDIIDRELDTAHENVVAANQHIVDANELQRKSKKKYIILAVIILVVCAVVTGIVFIAK